MRKLKVLQVLSLTMILSFLLVSSASAATVLFWDNYNASNPSYLDSQPWYNEVKSLMTTAGYTPTESYKAPATRILSDMQKSIGLFEWAGHGYPGEMVTSDGTTYNLYAKGSFYDIHDDLPSGSTTGKTWWFLGCSQGLSDSVNGDLWTEIAAKGSSTIKFFGVDTDYLQLTAQKWNLFSWQYLSQHRDLNYSIMTGFADAKAYTNDFNLPNMIYHVK